jgi:hypothetical protein
MVPASGQRLEQLVDVVQDPVADQAGDAHALASGKEAERRQQHKSAAIRRASAHGGADGLKPGGHVGAAGRRSGDVAGGL